jgi:glycogen operon protein
MTDSDWNVGYAKSLAVFLNGEAITEPDRRGRPIRDDSFLLLFNAHHDTIKFTIPKDYGEMWQTEIDTAMPIGLDVRMCRAGEGVDVPGRSVRVLRRV